VLVASERPGRDLRRIDVTDAVGSDDSQRLHAFAWSGLRYGSVWGGRESGRRELVIGILDETGTKLFGEQPTGFALMTNASPRVSWVGDRFIVSWISEFDRDSLYHLWAFAFDEDGTVLVPPVELGVETPGDEWSAPAIATTTVTADELVVLWSIRHADGTSEISFLRVDRALNILTGPTVAFTTPDNGRVRSAAFTGAEVIAAWVAPPGVGDFYLTPLSLDGVPTRPDLLIEGTVVREPQLIWTGTEIAAAYVHGGRARLARIDQADWTVVERAFVSEPGVPVFLPSIASSSERFGVAWQDRRLADNQEIYFSSVACCATSASLSADPPRICVGESTTLDAGSSSVLNCSGALDYQFEEGATVLRPFDPAPLFSVSPSTSTTYTVRVRCNADTTCEGTFSLSVDIVPDIVPDDLGNALRAVRSASDVIVSWAATPNASTYTLYRGISKGVWAPLLTGLTSLMEALPDVPGPPNRYFYRVAGVSCSGSPGP